MPLPCLTHNKRSLTPVNGHGHAIFEVSAIRRSNFNLATPKTQARHHHTLSLSVPPFLLIAGLQYFPCNVVFLSATEATAFRELDLALLFRTCLYSVHVGDEEPIPERDGQEDQRRKEINLGLVSS